MGQKNKSPGLFKTDQTNVYKVHECDLLSAFTWHLTVMKLLRFLHVASLEMVWRMTSLACGTGGWVGAPPESFSHFHHENGVSA